jgi:hypothetical protein
MIPANRRAAQTGARAMEHQTDWEKKDTARSQGAWDLVMTHRRS